ncbi:hypothetical protein A2W13_00300 [Candidatus Woesebacteria bacterium RBG_16_36_11]|uniref:Glycosyltransferase 2-like domain-containing protein n=1 Tax=Candidatus Woesebacteria bacterium RBG_16_36_11 TaxID=1802481 RepID=A0A1F7X732_9BACT|nr:MAG: hypothetical protein A2W13_00300 [Candidatus Woesebacteria bacterium RBG_16_36_11]
MKFSFIIPVLNEEKYIAKCIYSIKKQFGEDFEIIVVDNGSKDKTVEIVNKMGVSLVYERKKGISNARNTGAKKAKGELLCFMDADGILSNNWLVEVRKTINKSNVLNLVGLNIFTNKNIIKKIYYNIFTLFAYLLLILNKIIFGKVFLPGNNLVIRRSIFLKLGGFEPYVAEDLFLSRKFWMLKNEKAIFNHKMVIYYSSRGFDTAGYIRTILYWILASVHRIPGDNYSYKSKNIR